MGSPAFFAPELCTDDETQVSPAVDIWAAGLTLYMFVFGHMPFDALSIVCSPCLARVLPYIRPRARSACTSFLCLSVHANEASALRSHERFGVPSRCFCSHPWQKLAVQQVHPTPLTYTHTHIRARRLSCSGRLSIAFLAKRGSGVHYTSHTFTRPHVHTQAELQRQIVNNYVSFPWAVDHELEDLILACLRKDPRERIDAVEILHHPWMTADPPKTAVAIRAPDWCVRVCVCVWDCGAAGLSFSTGCNVTLCTCGTVSLAERRACMDNHIHGPASFRDGQGSLAQAVMSAALRQCAETPSTAATGA